MSILIVSKLEFDPIVEKVISWLDYYNAKWIRLNPDDFLTDEINLLHNNNPLVDSFQTVNIIWLRRLFSDSLFHEYLNSDIITPLNAIRLHYFLQNELRSILDFILPNKSSIKWLTHPSEIYINKLQVSEMAKSLSINAPDSIITSRKHILIDFYKKHHRIITKPISNIVNLMNDNDIYRPYTQLLSLAEINELPDSFFPSLFQRCIEKEFEIRVFYIDGKFYSMAMFTQFTTEEVIDIRNSDDIFIRSVPFSLPSALELRIIQLLQKLNISNASIDLIYSTNGEFYFLECNPVGQILMTSEPCNYYLEETIAKYLIANDN